MSQNEIYFYLHSEFIGWYLCNGLVGRWIQGISNTTYLSRKRGTSDGLSADGPRLDFVETVITLRKTCINDELQALKSNDVQMATEIVQTEI